MLLKPKKSNLNEPAILFKRYSVPESASVMRDTNRIYKTDYLAYIPSSQEDADTWAINEWNGFTNVDGRFVWTDGDNYYYSLNANQYMLNKNTNTWEAVTWTFANEENVNIFGRYVWTDGENIYYNAGILPNIGDVSLYLDKATKTWYPMSWSGLTNFRGDHIWHRGEDIYYSYRTSHYKLDVDTNTWSAYTWYGLTNFDGNYVWNIGNTYYYSDNYNNQYTLPTNSNTWETMTWVGGYSNFDSSDIWNIGDKYYMSTGYSDEQYELVDGTNQWVTKTWNGVDDIDGIYVKEIYGKYYYLHIASQYVLSEQSVITQYWRFDTELLTFIEVDYATLNQVQLDNIVEFTPTIEKPLVYIYSGGANAYYLVYVNEQTSWLYTHYDTIESITTQYEILEPKKAYQDKQYNYVKNLYYNAGYFDYVITGSIDKSTGQRIKGLLTPTYAQTIRTDDDINIDNEDLVVFDGMLYGIESIEISQKKMPRPYNIQYLTLNNIL